MSHGSFQKIELRDGRALAYTELGDPAGRPVFYFHGFPGSRLEARMVERVLEREGVRLLAVDRPGYGGSDFKPGRTISDWPDDVEQLADALELDAFAVVGASGGGPYAAACAWKSSRRLVGTGIVCGLGPPESLHDATGIITLNRWGLRLAGRAPWTAAPVFAAISPVLRRFPGLAVSHLARVATEPDRMALSKPMVRAALRSSLAEAFRQGFRGPARDGVLYARPWGIPLERIEGPVYLWHGERDVIVPPSMGRHVERSIPDCRATYYAGEGHFSLVVNRLPEMLSAL